MSQTWESVEATRAALTKDCATSLGASFEWEHPGHQKSWLELTARERRALLAADPDRSSESLSGRIAVLAYHWMQDNRVADALTLFDDLLEFGDLDPRTYNNALWAVMDDNSRLGVQPERARRYLATCLPHGPQNPSIFFNAACVLFELGELDSAIEAIAQAKAHDYDLEKIRDEKLLEPLRDHPGWEPLFAHLDPPAVKDLDEALAHPEKVRALQLSGLADFPESIATLTELEVLDVSTSHFPTLPVWLAELPKLRKLELNWNRSFKEIPDEVLAMPSLRSVSFYESALPKRYQQLQINALLGGFAKANASRETRLLHLALLFGDQKKALARGELRDLVQALDSNLRDVRAFALRVLEKKLGPVSLDIPKGGELLLLGKLAADRDVIAERLGGMGATLGKKRGPKTCAVVLGEQPKGKALELIEAGLPLALEVHLRAALDANEKPHLVAGGEESTELSARVGELLLSSDKANLKLAIDMMKRGGVPGGVFEELFLVMQNTQADKKLREEAKKLFAQYAPRELQDAVKKVFARTSIYLSGEGKVCSRIRSLAKRSKGAIDPVKLATLLLPEHGYSYLFEVGKEDEPVAERTLRTMLKDGALDFSGGELEELPAAIVKLTGLKKLMLGQRLGSHNRLTAVPELLLELSELELLDLSDNRLSSIPDSIGRLANLRELDVSSNFFRSFPNAVFGLAQLRRLDVSTSRYGAHREIPLKELPEGIGALTRLERLELRAHHFTDLPESMRGLKRLKQLDLSSGKLGRLPEWLTELPALEELDLAYTEVGHAEGSKAVVERLRARGVKVEE